MKNRFFSVLISLAITIVLEIILVFTTSGLAQNAEANRTALRLLTMVGGSLPWGLIQAFTFFLFFYGILEIRQFMSNLKTQARIFDKHLLNEKENWILSPADVSQLKLEVLEFEKKEKFVVTHLIKLVCNKYRANKSTSEALEVLTAQTRINRENDESSQSMIRYVAWAIPSVGFIGTVIGIADSLGSVKQNMSAVELTYVTSALNVAFDTTLVALVLSLVLMYLFHRLQEGVERFHTRSEEYIIEHLINRIYNS